MSVQALAERSPVSLAVDPERYSVKEGESCTKFSVYPVSERSLEGLSIKAFICSSGPHFVNLRLFFAGLHTHKCSRSPFDASGSEAKRRKLRFQNTLDLEKRLYF